MSAEQPQPARTGLSPSEVSVRVAAILEAAERDARAIIAAAQQEATAPPPAPPAQPAQSAPAAPDYFAAALATLTGRVDVLEANVDARLEVLWRALSSPRGTVTSQTPLPPANTARHSEPAAAPAGGQAERVRAVDLALRGYSREQIATALRSSLDPGDVDRLLDEVLEYA
jgi:hypothetical protein